MSQIVLSNINQLINIVDKYDEILSVGEFLKEINYNFEYVIIDKFWSSIQHDKWVYINEDMLKYIGYNSNEIYHAKSNYIKLIKDNFIESDDYKLINNKEFKDISISLISDIENIEANAHNKTKHLIVSPDCFKESLMLMRTDKSKQIKKYYLELEKIYKYYMIYENLYKDKLVENAITELQNERCNKLLEKHNLLIDKFKYKKCIYICIIGENIYKIGYTADIKERIEKLKNKYYVEYLVDIFETEYNIEVEREILESEIIKKHLYNKKINNILSSREVVQLSEQFNYDDLVNLVKKCVNSVIPRLTPSQVLENKKIDLMNLLLEKGYDPNIVNTFQIDNNKDNINIDKSEIIDIIDNKVTNIVNELESKEISDEIINKVANMRQIRKPIQKIDPNDLTKVVKAYKSIIHLMRSPEGQLLNKASIYRAIRESTIYHNYRWNFVEFNQDVNISTLTEPSKEVAYIKIETICKLNSDKSKILDTYESFKKCYKSVGIGQHSMRKIINDNLLHKEHYYVKMSQVNQELIDNYDKPINKFIYNKYKTIPVIMINPDTNVETRYNTIEEVIVKFPVSSELIKRAVNTEKLYYNHYWRFVDNE